MDEMNATELYPAGYLYHEYATGLALKSKLRSADDYAVRGMTVDGASVIERIGVRIFPIGYDLLIGAILLIVLGRYVSREAGEWGAALYLFNPGAMVDSSMWNYDSLPSFYLLAAVVLVGIALQSGRDIYLLLAWVAAGFAICMKLQAGMILPILGWITLLTRRPRLVILGPGVFFATLAFIYSPYLLGRQVTYLKRVFVNSFQSYPVTHAGAYNLWGLWYQRPVTDTLAGFSFEWIGRGMFLVAMTWLAWWVFKQKVATGGNSLRRTAIVFTYAFSAPFILLTRMHERYLAPAVAVAVLAGFLDPRMRGVMWGISVGYAVNLLAVLTQGVWNTQSEILLQAIHTSYCVVRFFCCSLIVGSFLWLAWQLPNLLKSVESKPERANDSVRVQVAEA